MEQINYFYQNYPFKLMPLPYSYDALEPYIDAETLHYHHDKHLKTYVENLNKTLEPYPIYHNWDLVKLIKNTDYLPSEIKIPVKNNAGGVYNHQLYFICMEKPYSEEPHGKIASIIEESFGSYIDFKSKMKQAAVSQFGSGYAWLIKDINGKLKITNTPNQDTPFYNGIIPILLVDVWEHAYYLKYKNLRGDYVDNWFKLINWNKVSENYAHI